MSPEMDQYCDLVIERLGQKIVPSLFVLFYAVLCL